MDSGFRFPAPGCQALGEQFFGGADMDNSGAGITGSRGLNGGSRSVDDDGLPLGQMNIYRPGDTVTGVVRLPGKGIFIGDRPGMEFFDANSQMCFATGILGTGNFAPRKVKANVCRQHSFRAINQCIFSGPGRPDNDNQFAVCQFITRLNENIISQSGQVIALSRYRKVTVS